MGEALKRESRWSTPLSRPPLFGVAVGVKDIIGVAGLPTRGGARLPSEAFLVPEATVVSRLISAGAIMIGKTSTDELAYLEPPETRNPHDLSLSPGGSSAGSAAGVACGFFPLALGTQTTRSLIAPASFCGIVGFKPSHGRVPSHGIIPLSPFMDTPGFFVRDVAGVAFAASILVEGWREVPSPIPSLGVPAEPYLSGQLESTWRPGFESALAALRAGGLSVSTMPSPWPVDLDMIYRASSLVLHGEMARTHARLPSDLRGQLRERTLKGLDRGSLIGDQELEEARELGRRLRFELGIWMDRAGVDALISPSQPAPAPPLLEGRSGWGGTTSPWSFAGLPCLSLPATRAGGLPIGFQLIGRFGADEQLLAVADIAYDLIQDSG